ncbi:MAG: hypothetical protein Q9227_008236 [Pyrenula ochraceoflavens]
MAPVLCKALLSLFAGATPLLPDSQHPFSTPTLANPPSALTTPPQNPIPSPSSSPPLSNTALIDSLILAPSEQDKLAILVPNPPNVANLTYTFINNTVSPPTGGTIALAAIDAFPALQLGNVAAAIGFVNPCGLNTPHSHPRASEFLTVVRGELVTGLILEENPGSAGNVVGGAAPDNGPLPQVGTTLQLYQGTLFPQGSVHFQFNPTCEPAVFAAAFDNRDPGRIQIVSGQTRSSSPL